MTIKKICFISFYILSFSVFSQKKVEIPVWPHGAPEENGITEPEKCSSEGHIENSKEAKIFIYLPKKNNKPSKAVLICPGGGYRILAINHEGHDLAKWLTKNGTAAIVLKYRMPNGHSLIPLSDLTESMKIIRQNAKRWNIDLNQIGLCGFSAGGHLASTFSSHCSDSLRPNFVILFYPVITFTNSLPKTGSKKSLIEENPDTSKINYFSSEKHVNLNSPPTLLILADNDKVVLPNHSLLYYEALKANKVNASLIILPSGGHGFGFKKDFKYHKEITYILSDWLKINHQKSLQ